MGTSTASTRIIRFGVFEVDLNAAELRRRQAFNKASNGAAR
jgi:hypothetical protein